MTGDETAYFDRFAEDGAAYVHIPFCSAICPYCDFAVVAGQDELAGRYVAAMRAEIARSERWRPLRAIYFGGGTPSHIAPGLLASILETIDGHHGIAADAEISLEANPEDFDVHRARQLKAVGFNRVSFGAQSFDGAVLSDLGRRHGIGQIEESLNAAMAAGFENLSVDLIFGTPGESDESWSRTLGLAVGTGVSHISCYALTVEKGTPLSRSVTVGAPAPDPDVQADRYEAANEWLGSLGLRRYEVSNWSRPGFECRYNLVVWAQGEYEAYGNGAHGFRGGVRYRNHRRVDAYIERVESGESPRAGEEPVTGWDAELDRLFVGLRRTVGVRQGPGTEALLASSEGRSLVDAGVLAVQNGRLSVLRPLVTDAVHRSVLGLAALSS
ncbi:MAG TPA: radical SAM family heme chaperone HemW [Acidimicrobiia bacterium]